jgi:hypothetical protein
MGHMSHMNTVLPQFNGNISCQQGILKGNLVAIYRTLFNYTSPNIPEVVLKMSPSARVFTYLHNAYSYATTKEHIRYNRIHKTTQLRRWET